MNLGALLYKFGTSSAMLSAFTLLWSSIDGDYYKIVKGCNCGTEFFLHLIKLHKIQHCPSYELQTAHFPTQTTLPSKYLSYLRFYFAPQGA